LTYFEEKGKGSNSRGRNEKHYINKYCTTFLGEKGSPNDLVFSGLTKIDKYRVTPNWIKKAGIKKQITFHAFRHTYAMLLLNNGADPYGVSKSMGHKSLKTTEIYVHQLDELKKRTANRFKSNE
jgi:integrase